MARTELKFLEAKMEINDIQDVVITPIEQDVDGTFVREIRFTGSYEEGGLAGQPRNLTLRIKGATEAAIEITTPNLQM